MGRLLAEQAVPVVALVGSRAAGHGRVGFGPRQEALEEREAPEHAAGPVVGREDGVLDPEAAQRVADLERPGAAADDDQRVVARREGPLG